MLVAEFLFLTPCSLCSLWFISAFRPLLPSFHDLADGAFEGLGDVPRWKLGAHFAEVEVVADVVADAAFIDIGIDLRLICQFLGDFKSLEDRAGIRLAATKAAMKRATSNE